MHENLTRTLHAAGLIRMRPLMDTCPNRLEGEARRENSKSSAHSAVGGPQDFGRLGNLIRL
jgi:hypothetical protein